MRSTLILLVGLCFFSPVQSFPEGIDDRGDRGCICHGGEDETTEVIVSGLPEMYNSSVTYNFTITINSPVIETTSEDQAKGGFRVIISKGEIVADEWQYLEGGYTHNETINKQRTWNASWIAPENDAELATFIVHGNAVNGNGESTGDEWNSLALAIPGVNYTGEIITPELGDDHNRNRFLVISSISIASLVAIIYFVAKD